MTTPNVVTPATVPSSPLPSQGRGRGLGSSWSRSISARLMALVLLSVRTNAGRIGLLVVAFYFVLAVAGPRVAPYAPTAFHLDHQLEGPSSQFWLGTDQFGRDILSRIMAGARSVIAISVAGTTLGLLLGTVAGMSSGYIGGLFDEILMRVTDGLMAFPSLLLGLLVLTMAPPPERWLPSWLAWDGLNIVFTIGVVFMPFVARVVRSATLPLKNAEFVQVARLRGESTLYIIFVELLPNTMPVVSVEASIRLSYAILLAASLGFLGLGVQPPSPDWGLMISESREFVVSAPWVALAPAGAIVFLVVSVNLLFDGLRQARALPRRRTTS